MLRFNYFLTVATACCLFSSESLNAQERGSGGDVVKVFEQFCLVHGSDVERVSVDLNANVGWQPAPFPTDFRLDKAVVAKAWKGTIGERSFELLVTQASYATVCMLRTPDKERSMLAYLDPLEEALKKFGIKGKSIDFPHYFMASGKMANRKRAQAELSTRSFRGINTNYTSIRITY